MELDFNGKNVLITGGSRGIGKACAVLFAQLNANVAFTYKSNLEAAEKTLSELEYSGRHRIYRLDMADPHHIKEVVDQIIRDMYHIDILINNAGVFLEHKLAEIDYEQWQRVWNETIETNLTGVSNLSYLVARHMIERGGGKMVNVSSRGAFRGEPNCPGYGASKAGLNSLSQSLAQYLAPYNITVGVIAPGFVDTDMAYDHLHGEKGEETKKQSPLNRAASAEEIARVIVLSAMEGIDYMTGGIIDVNGASYLRS